MAYKPQTLSSADGGTGVSNASNITVGGALTTANSLSTPTGVNVTFCGSRLAAADVDAIQFLMSSGNISTGEFVLYGLTA